MRKISRLNKLFSKTLSLCLLLLATVSFSVANEYPMQISGWTSEEIEWVTIHWLTSATTKIAKKNNLSAHVPENQRLTSPNALVKHINQYVATRMPEDEFIHAERESIQGKLGVEILMTSLYPSNLDSNEQAHIISSKQEELIKNYCELVVDAKFPVNVKFSALVQRYIPTPPYTRNETFGYFKFEKDLCEQNPNLWETGLRKFFKW